MAHCINLRHPDFLDLVAQTSLPPVVLAAKMNTWMDKNNTTEWPSLDDINVESAEADKYDWPAGYEYDTTLRERIFHGEDMIGARQFLTELIERTPDHYSSELAKALLKLDLSDITMFLTPLKVLNKGRKKEDGVVTGKFLHISNVIEIGEDAKFNKGVANTVIMHEIMHAASLSFIRRHPEHPTVKALDRLFTYAKEVTSNRDLYGYTDIYEFVSELYTNINFINDLKSIPATEDKFENLFVEVWNKILEMFGITEVQNTLYEQAFALGSQVITESIRTDNEILNILAMDFTSEDEMEAAHAVPINSVIPLKGNEGLYKKYNLLNNKGQIKQFDPRAISTQKFVKSLNRSPYYQFTLREVPDGSHRIFITSKGFFQVESKENKQPANKELDAKLTALLARIGVNVASVDKIVVRDKNGKVLEGNARLVMLGESLKAVIEIVEGKRSIDTLPEEAAHLLIELLQDHPLVQKMMRDIENYEIYQKVKETYGQLEGYDENKIRKEAVGQLIAQYIVAKETGAEEPQQIQRAQSWWSALWNYIISKFRRVASSEVEATINPFRQFAEKVLRGDDQLVQEATDQFAFWDKPVEMFSFTAKEKQQQADNITNLTTARVNKDKEGYVDAKNGRRILYRVHTIVKQYYRTIFGSSDVESPRAKAAAVWGTVIHGYMQHIFDRVAAGKTVDYAEISDEVLKMHDNDPDLRGKKVSLRHFNELVVCVEATYKMIKERDDSIKRAAGLTEDEWNLPENQMQLFTELVIYNPDTDMAGTIDVAVVHANGVVSIVDWKSMQFQERAGTVTRGVPWYKRRAWEIQLEGYKNIMRDSYGITEFGLLRLIPIHVKMDSKNNLEEIDAINSGNKPYLDPIASIYERTQIQAINERIDSLQKTREKYLNITQSKTAGPAQKKVAYQEIENLDHVISSLQTKLDMEAVYQDMKRLIKFWNDREALSASHPNRDDLAMYYEELHHYLSIFHEFYADIEAAVASGEMDMSKEELAKMSELPSMLEVLSRIVRIGMKEIAQGDSDINIMQGGRMPGFLKRIFGSLSSFNIGVFKRLYEVVHKNYETARHQTNAYIDRMIKVQNELKVWAATHGMSEMDAYKKLVDVETGMIHTRINTQYRKDKKKAKEDKDIAWFVANTEVIQVWDEASQDMSYDYAGESKANFDRIRALKEKMLKDQYKGRTDADKIVAAEMKVWDNQYNISVNINALYNTKNNFARPSNTVSAKYLSKEWQYIQDNAPLKAYYDEYLAINRELAGLAGAEIDENFVANISQSIIDKMAQFGSIGFKGMQSSLRHVLQTRQNDEIKGGALDIFDEEGKPIQRVPLMYMDALREPISKEERAAIEKEMKEKYTRDGVLDEEGYKDAVETEVINKEIAKGRKAKSIDLTRSMVLFAHAATVHAAFSNTEGIAIALRHILASGQVEMTRKDKKGSNVVDKFTDKVMTSIGVPKDTLDTFDQFINLIWYGRRDQGLEGTIPGTNMSSTKVIQKGMEWISASALALKPILGFSNFMGGSVNAMEMGAEGKYFTVAEWVKSGQMIASLDKKALAAIKLFEPFAHDIIKIKANKMSASTLTEWVNMDTLYIFLRKGDQLIDSGILLSMMQHYGVDKDGRIRLLADIEKAGNKSESLLDLMQLDEKGITWKVEISEEEFDKFRAKVQDRAHKIKGSIPESDVNLVGANIASTVIMQFKRWMPGLVTQRFQEFQYNNVMEAADVGRFKVMFGEFTQKGVLPKLNAFLNLSKEVMAMGLWHGKPNMEVTKRYYEKYKAEHRLDPKEFTLEDFIQLRTEKIRGAAMELRAVLLMLLFVLGAKALIPEDKDDPTRDATILGYRLVNRSLLEVSFFLLPSSATQLISRPVPPVTYLTNVVKFLENTVEETGYVISGKRDKRDKNPPLYYFSKLVPGVVAYADFFDIWDTYNPSSGWRY